MIAYIKGILTVVEINYIIVETNGIGYQIQVHNRIFANLPALGEKVLVYTYFQVTENEHRLFGFLEKNEIKLFEKIITVSGMGTKAGLSILSGMEPNAFCNAIITQDEKVLTTIPGIGKKSAARLIFELKDKLGDLALVVPATGGVNIAELIEAMEVLGYKASELMPLINELAESGKLQADTSINIKLLLQRINVNKA